MLPRPRVKDHRARMLHMRGPLLLDAGGLCSNMVRESARIVKAMEKAGRHGGESDRSRVVRHRHSHDPGLNLANAHR